MKKHLFSPSNLFSPLAAGAVGALGVTLALMGYVGLLNPVSRLAVSAWIAILIICLGTGLVLQLTTLRVLFIRVFFASMFALGAVACGYLLLVLLVPSDEVFVRLFVGALVFLVLAIVAIQTYLSVTKAPSRSTMPHDDFGVLDESTGFIDLSRSMRHSSSGNEQWNKAALIVRATLPIVAALSMWLVRSLPATGDLVLIVLCGSFFAVVNAMGVGKHFALAVSCQRWEEQHQMKILVKRT